MATGLRHKSLEIKVVTAELDIPQLAGVKTAAFRDSAPPVKPILTHCSTVLHESIVA
jgi:hypothetical protein